MTGEKCDCVDRMQVQLAKRNLRLVLGFEMTTMRGTPAPVPIVMTEKIEKRKPARGVVIPSYCPFCGRGLA